MSISALAIPVMCLAGGCWRSWRGLNDSLLLDIFYQKDPDGLGVSVFVFTTCVAPQNLTARIIQGAARVCCLHCLISLSVCFSNAIGVGGWDIIPQFIRSSLHLQQSFLVFLPFPGFLTQWPIVNSSSYSPLVWVFPQYGELPELF